MKKQLVISEKEAEWIEKALTVFAQEKREREEKNPNCDKYILGFECGILECLRRRVSELFEEENNAKPF